MSNLTTLEKPVWLEAGEVALYLGLDVRYVSERLCMQADFPKAYRYTPQGRRRWRLDEILAYRETKREKAA